MSVSGDDRATHFEANVYLSKSRNVNEQFNRRISVTLACWMSTMLSYNCANDKYSFIYDIPD